MSQEQNILKLGAGGQHTEAGQPQSAARPGATLALLQRATSGNKGKIGLPFKAAGILKTNLLNIFQGKGN